MLQAFMPKICVTCSFIVTITFCSCIGHLSSSAKTKTVDSRIVRVGGRRLSWFRGRALVAQARGV